MKTQTKSTAEVENEYALIICPGANRWQAFRRGSVIIGLGDTPEAAALNWRAKHQRTVTR